VPGGGGSLSPSGTLPRSGARPDASIPPTWGWGRSSAPSESVGSRIGVVATPVRATIGREAPALSDAPIWLRADRFRRISPAGSTVAAVTAVSCSLLDPRSPGLRRRPAREAVVPATLRRDPGLSRPSAETKDRLQPGLAALYAGQTSQQAAPTYAEPVRATAGTYRRCDPRP
jgi:hypothetical protein